MAFLLFIHISQSPPRPSLHLEIRERKMCASVISDMLPFPLPIVRLLVVTYKYLL